MCVCTHDARLIPMPGKRKTPTGRANDREVIGVSRRPIGVSRRPIARGIHCDRDAPCKWEKMLKKILQPFCVQQDTVDKSRATADLKDLPSCLRRLWKTTVLAGAFTPMAKVSVENSTLMRPRQNSISTTSVMMGSNPACQAMTLHGWSSGWFFG